MRLDRFLSNNTNYSRNEITKIIRSSRVSVNNIVTTTPNFHVSETDIIKLDNKEISNEKLYIALNKPKGYVCTNSICNKEKSIFELLDLNPNKFHICGRLDKDTTGLVIITNDGDFTHKLKKPSSNIEKEYEVELKYEFNDEMQSILKQPIKMDNKILKPFKITNINNNKLNIILVEGKYHQIKRMFEICNNQVINLKRIRIAKLHLNDLNMEIGQHLKINVNKII